MKHYIDNLIVVYKHKHKIFENENVFFAVEWRVQTAEPLTDLYYIRSECTIIIIIMFIRTTCTYLQYNRNH